MRVSVRIRSALYNKATFFFVFNCYICLPNETEREKREQCPFGAHIKGKTKKIDFEKINTNPN